MKAITITVSRPAAPGSAWRLATGRAELGFPDTPEGRRALEDEVLRLLHGLTAQEPESVDAEVLDGLG